MTSSSRFPLSRRTALKSLTLASMAVGLCMGVGAAVTPSKAPEGADVAFPTKPVRIVVPIAPGGSADKLTRLLAERLAVVWGQSVIVENVPGASGTIGAGKVAKAAPDGYTLLQQGEGITLNRLLLRNLPYDPDKSFTPVIKAVVNPQVLVVNPNTPYHTFQEYLDQARKAPEHISLALPGNGGIAQVAHAILDQETGTRVNYVPYPGGGPAAVDVIAGHADATLITLAAVTEYVRAGRLRALAVTTPYRSSALPDVPTMAEAGVPGFAVESWQGYFAPAGTPDAIVQKINRDIRAVLHAPDMRQQLEQMGFKVDGGTTQELAQSLRQEHPKYAKAVEAAGLRLQ